MEIDGVTQVDTTVKMGGAAPTQDELKKQLQQLQVHFGKTQVPLAIGTPLALGDVRPRLSQTFTAAAKAGCVART